MDIEKIRPFGPWILVKVDEPEKVTKSGIYLPDGNLDERLGHTTGTVLRLGNGVRNARTGQWLPYDLEVGDKIIFRGFLKEANRPGGVLDREHSLIHIQDVIGKLTDVCEELT